MLFAFHRIKQRKSTDIKSDLWYPSRTLKHKVIKSYCVKYVHIGITGNEEADKQQIKH